VRARAAQISIMTIVVCVGACSEPPEPSRPTPSQASPAVMVSLPIHPSPVTPDALFVGRLEVHDECLFLATVDGEIGVAWPTGTRWDARRQAITVRGVTAAAGDTVRLGGGFYDIGLDDIDTSPWITPPRPECLGDAFIFVGSLFRS
jgi:hypothetical protein